MLIAPKGFFISCDNSARVFPFSNSNISSNPNPFSPLTSSATNPSIIPVSQIVFFPSDKAIAVINFIFLSFFGIPFNFSIIAKFLSLSVPLRHLLVNTPGKPSKYSISIPESSAIHFFPLSSFAIVSAFFMAFPQKVFLLVLLIHCLIQ